MGGKKFQTEGGQKINYKKNPEISFRRNTDSFRGTVETWV